MTGPDARIVREVERMRGMATDDLERIIRESQPTKLLGKEYRSVAMQAAEWELARRRLDAGR